MVSGQYSVVRGEVFARLTKHLGEYWVGARFCLTEGGAIEMRSTSISSHRS